MSAPVVDEAMSKKLLDALIDEQNERARSAQKGIGPSEVGGCREYVRSKIFGAPQAPEPRVWRAAAEIGTILGDEFEQVFGRRLGGTAQVKLTAVMPRTGLTISGSADALFIKENDLIDLKGLALDTPIPTPDGWTLMRDIEPGDFVIDMDGNPVEVLGVSDVKNIGCYQVSTRGEAPIICDENHIWWARVGGGELAEYTAPELAAATAKGKRVNIPVTQPLHTPAASLPLDPWYVGYWLGNGGLGAGLVTTHGDDLSDVGTILRSAGFDVNTRMHEDRNAGYASPTLPGWRAPGAPTMTGQLREIGILKDKHIPSAYLRGSIDQRKALLRGLMDSDGTWNVARQRAVFTSTSARLAADFVELVRSLGERPQFSSVQRSGFGLTVTSYDIEWTPAFNPFALPRKRNKVDLETFGARKRYRRAYYSVKVAEVDSVPTRCITVDSPTSSFLAGEQMMPTHNSKDGLATIRREGPSLENMIQLAIYSLAAVQMGILQEGLTAYLVYYDRAGSDAELMAVPVEWEALMRFIEIAEDRLMDVVAAQEALDAGDTSLLHGLRDKAPSFCFSDKVQCSFRLNCWRGSDWTPGGEITDPDEADAVRRYVEAREEAKQVASRQKVARADLEGVEGVTPDGWVVGWAKNRISVTKEVQS